jgi:hypothetical protein
MYCTYSHVSISFSCNVQSNLFQYKSQVHYVFDINPGDQGSPIIFFKKLVSVQIYIKNRHVYSHVYYQKLESSKLGTQCLVIGLTEVFLSSHSFDTKREVNVKINFFCHYYERGTFLQIMFKHEWNHKRKK